VPERVQPKGFRTDGEVHNGNFAYSIGAIPNDPSAAAIRRSLSPPADSCSVHAAYILIQVEMLRSYFDATARSVVAEGQVVNIQQDVVAMDAES
jgi:hypothetical protein